MTETHTRDRRPVEEIGTDVLVCGGGAAGLAAAHTAARQGVRVILLERYGFCVWGRRGGAVGNGMRPLSGDPPER
jgi:flavin-dependent dehydrogenase